jgi:hypothetical protein
MDGPRTSSFYDDFLRFRGNLPGMGVPDEFAILSAVWILASNDERSLITYRRIQHRLHLPEGFDVRGLIGQHGELFRLNMPLSALVPWKAELKTGKGLPGWLREIPASERLAHIDRLSTSDGFRSQFRAAIKAPRSEVVVIEWGLGHIERLRKARNEAREATAKSWQMWLVFGTSCLGVIATIIAAIVAAKYGHR